MAVYLYHVNARNGEVGLCKAEKGNCPFGGPWEHFTDQFEARKAFENMNDEKFSVFTAKQLPKAKASSEALTQELAKEEHELARLDQARDAFRREWDVAIHGHELRYSKSEQLDRIESLRKRKPYERKSDQEKTMKIMTLGGVAAATIPANPMIGSALLAAVAFGSIPLWKQKIKTVRQVRKEREAIWEATTDKTPEAKRNLELLSVEERRAKYREVLAKEQLVMTEEHDAVRTRIKELKIDRERALLHEKALRGELTRKEFMTG